MRGDAGVDGPLGVVYPGDPLEHERVAPLLAQPGHVLPAGRRRLHPGPVGGEEWGPRLTLLGHVRCGEIGQLTGFGEGVQPAGTGKRFGGEAGHRLQAQGLGDHRTAPIAAVRERPVQGGDQPDGSGGAGPLYPLEDFIPRADPIDLEEGLRVGGDHLLDRLAGKRAEAHGGAAGGRGPGDRHLAVGVDGLDAGRRDQDRQGDGLAHDRGGQVAGGRRSGDVGCEPELAVGGDVVLDRDPLLGTGQQGGVDRFGQALLGPALGLQNRLEPFVAHFDPLTERGIGSRASPTEPPRPGNTRSNAVRSRLKSP